MILLCYDTMLCTDEVSISCQKKFVHILSKKNKQTEHLAAFNTEKAVQQD